MFEAFVSKFMGRTNMVLGGALEELQLVTLVSVPR